MAEYWEIAAYSAYDIFSQYKYLSVSSFLTSVCGVGSFFLKFPFPDHCLLLLLYQGYASYIHLIILVMPILKQKKKYPLLSLAIYKNTVAGWF